MKKFKLVIALVCLGSGCLILDNPLGSQFLPLIGESCTGETCDTLTRKLDCSTCSLTKIEFELCNPAFTKTQNGLNLIQMTIKCQSEEKILNILKGVGDGAFDVGYPENCVWPPCNPTTVTPIDYPNVCAVQDLADDSDNILPPTSSLTEITGYASAGKTPVGFQLGTKNFGVTTGTPGTQYAIDGPIIGFQLKLNSESGIRSLQFISGDICIPVTTGLTQFVSLGDTKTIPIYDTSVTQTYYQNQCTKGDQSRQFGITLCPLFELATWSKVSLQIKPGLSAIDVTGISETCTINYGAASSLVTIPVTLVDCQLGVTEAQVSLGEVYVIDLFKKTFSGLQTTEEYIEKCASYFFKTDSYYPQPTWATISEPNYQLTMNPPLTAFIGEETINIQHVDNSVLKITVVNCHPNTEKVYARVGELLDFKLYRQTLASYFKSQCEGMDWTLGSTEPKWLSISNDAESQDIRLTGQPATVDDVGDEFKQWAITIALNEAGRNDVTMVVQVDPVCNERTDWPAVTQGADKPLQKEYDLIMDVDEAVFNIPVQLPQDSDEKSWSILCDNAQVSYKQEPETAFVFITYEKTAGNEKDVITVKPVIGQDLSGFYTLTITQTSKYGNAFVTEISLHLYNCWPKTDLQTQIDIFEKQREVLYTQDNLAEYLQYCSKILFNLQNIVSSGLSEPEQWISIDTDTYELVSYPFKVSHVNHEQLWTFEIYIGAKHFAYAKTVDPQCYERQDLGVPKGLENWEFKYYMDSSGVDSLRLFEFFEQKEFTVKTILPVDSDIQSWSLECGFAQVEAKLDKKDFVTMFQNETSGYEQGSPYYLSIAPQYGDHGDYKLSLTYTNSISTSYITRRQKQITVLSNDCGLPASLLTMTASIDETKRFVFWRQDVFNSQEKYRVICSNIEMMVEDNPSWVTIDDISFELVVSPPDLVSNVGQYTFKLLIWSVTLTVVGPCDTKSLEGLDDNNVLTISLSEVVQLHSKTMKEDLQGTNYAEVCGIATFTGLLFEPHFVKISEEGDFIEVKPTEQKDVGLWLMLVEQKRNDDTYFTAIRIFVLSIEDAEGVIEVKPYFYPKLSNQIKQYGQEWFYILPPIVDPAGKYARVESILIDPEMADSTLRKTGFIKKTRSSNQYPDDTLIFSISEGAWTEITGNLSVFINIQAFNSNYTVYERSPQPVKTALWRWRKALYSFNLTVLPPPANPEIKNNATAQQSTRVCQNRNVLKKARVRLSQYTKLALEMCEPTNFEKNVTISDKGEMQIVFGDYFRLDRMFTQANIIIYDEQLPMSNVFFINTIDKTERSLNNSVNWTLTSFDSETNTVNFNLQFDDPWDDSDTKLLQIMICGEVFEVEFQRNLKGGCLEVVRNIPSQILPLEQQILEVISRMVLIMISFKVIEQLDGSVTKLINPPFLTPFSTLIMICHLFAINVEIPAAAQELIGNLLSLLTFDVFNARKNYKAERFWSLGVLGYQSVSVGRNTGSLVMVFVECVVMLGVVEISRLYYRHRHSKYKPISTFLANFSLLDSLTNFFLGYQLIFQISGLIFATQFNKLGESKVSNFDFQLTVIIGMATLTLILFLPVVVTVQGYAGLQQRIQQDRQKYAYEHRLAMVTSKRVKHTMHQLELKYDAIDARYNDMHRHIGSQCFEFQPELVGFIRPTVHLALEWNRPLFIAAILLFVKNPHLQLVSFLVLHACYYLSTLVLVRAVPPNPSTCLLCLALLYLQLSLTMEPTAKSKNLIGWVFVAIVWSKIQTVFCQEALLYLRHVFERLRQSYRIRQYLQKIRSVQVQGKEEAFLERTVKVKKPSRIRNLVEEFLSQSKQIRISSKATRNITSNFVKKIGKRGFRVVENAGDGDCLFQTLSVLLWGTASSHPHMRQWIVERMKEFPQRYNLFSTYSMFKSHCLRMAVVGTPGTILEIQAAADIFFTKIMVWTVADAIRPWRVIVPFRLENLNKLSCKNIVDIWRRNENHCAAMVNSGTPQTLTKAMRESLEVRLRIQKNFTKLSRRHQIQQEQVISFGQLTSYLTTQAPWEADISEIVNKLDQCRKSKNAKESQISTETSKMILQRELDKLDGEKADEEFLVEEYEVEEKVDEEIEIEEIESKNEKKSQITLLTKMFLERQPEPEEEEVSIVSEEIEPNKPLFPEEPDLLDTPKSTQEFEKEPEEKQLPEEAEAKTEQMAAIIAEEASIKEEEEDKIEPSRLAIAISQLLCQQRKQNASTLQRISAQKEAKQKRSKPLFVFDSD